MAPQVGFLWTPGWWGWNDGGYVWHAGFWGPQIGFYGGIDYGFGYPGHGYEGGYWRGNQFYYNRSVNNITNVTNITNVYNKTVVNTSVNHVSYNGGQGGVRVQPSAQERAAEQERHVGLTPDQTRHVQVASQNRELRASVNQGKPPVAATEKPAQLSGREVVAARAAGGPVHITPQPHGGQARQGGAQDRPQVQQQRGQEEQRAQAQREEQQRSQQQEQRAQAQREQQQRGQQERSAQAEERQRANAEQLRRAQQEQQRAQPGEHPDRIRQAEAPAQHNAKPLAHEQQPEKRNAHEQPPRDEKHPQDHQ
jgi:hypothetical protein